MDDLEILAWVDGCIAERRDKAVERMRRDGMSWGQVGESLGGLTAQAARKRYQRRGETWVEPETALKVGQHPRLSLLEQLRAEPPEPDDGTDRLYMKVTAVDGELVTGELFAVDEWEDGHPIADSVRLIVSVRMPFGLASVGSVVRVALLPWG